jgi:hypothetical protein
MINKIYRNIERKRLIPTTTEQLLYLSNSNVLNYNELVNYDNLDEIFTDDACIIFFPNKLSPVGHWTVIFKITGNTVEFFDSYGNPPKYYEDNRHLLTRIINNSQYIAYYNPYRFQSKKSSACGRHVLNRLLLRDLPIEEYRRVVTYGGQSDFADDFVTFSTMEI